VTDLKSRGMLDDTLVIWMGEFGRTPKINKDTGRDHHQKAFTVALAGAGIQGGRILGATSADGSEVTDRPVTVPDLFCTFCHALGIDPRLENETPVGRPIKIVDGGRPVLELFG
jgi:arylsulfatase A-like enzyme